MTFHPKGYYEMWMSGGKIVSRRIINPERVKRGHRDAELEYIADGRGNIEVHWLWANRAIKKGMGTYLLKDLMRRYPDDAIHLDDESGIDGYYKGLGFTMVGTGDEPRYVRSIRRQRPRKTILDRAVRMVKR